MSLMQAIWTEDEEAQQDAAHQIIQIPKPWTIRRWLELTVGIGKGLVQIRKENTHLIDLKSTKEVHQKLQTMVERYISQGASGAWRVHRWQPAYFAVVLGDTEDSNNVSRHCYDGWPIDSWVDCPIVWWVRETFLIILSNKPAEHPEPGHVDRSSEVLLPEQERHGNVLSSTHPPQKSVLFCSLRGQVRHLNWWLIKYFADHVGIFQIDAAMGNDGRTVRELILQDSQNHSIYITTPKMGGTGLNLTAANHVEITPKF